MTVNERAQRLESTPSPGLTFGGSSDLRAFVLSPGQGWPISTVTVRWVTEKVGELRKEQQQPKTLTQENRTFLPLLFSGWRKGTTQRTEALTEDITVCADRRLVERRDEGSEDGGNICPLPSLCR